MEEWRYSSTILDPNTRWGEWSASHPYRFCPWGNRPRDPLDRRLGGPQSRSGLYGEQKNLASAGNRTPGGTGRGYTDLAIPALRNSCACLIFPPGFKYSKYVENKIY
jgi:hypothetical protein